MGYFGQAFVDALRSKVGGKSLGVYGVNYPATMDFPPPWTVSMTPATTSSRWRGVVPTPKWCSVAFPGGGRNGFRHLGGHTRWSTADAPKPMPPDVAKHVAAVALFGAPSNGFMNQIGAPPIAIGPLYVPKTTELCAAGDPVCSDGGDWAAHNSYADNGMVDQAATFAASHL